MRNLTKEQLTKIHSNIICIAFGISEYTFPIEETYFKAIINAAFMLKDCNIYCNNEPLSELINNLNVFYKTLKNENNNGNFIANLYEYYNKEQGCLTIPHELFTKRIPLKVLEDIYTKSIMDKLNQPINDILLYDCVSNLMKAKEFSFGFEKNYKMIDKWLEE